MSTEAGQTKRRLSRNTIESEERLADTSTNKPNKGADTETQTGEPLRSRQQQHGTDGDKTKNVGEQPGTIGEGSADTGAPDALGKPVPDDTSHQNVVPGDGTRQIIAVSANKNPTAFFQLARKFLMTNEMCDLSALEGAIVSAVDAAHLLERSKLATIVSINTSYVNVEPKRRRQQKSEEPTSEASKKEGVPSIQTSRNTMQSSRSQAVPATNDPSNATGTKENPSALSTPSKPATDHSTDTAESSVDETGRGMQQQQQSSPAAAVTRSATSSGSGTTRELRRARILVTVKRTESYKRWLEENPIQRQAIIAGTATVTAEEIVGKESSLPSSK